MLLIALRDISCFCRTPNFDSNPLRVLRSWLSLLATRSTEFQVNDSTELLKRWGCSEDLSKLLQKRPSLRKADQYNLHSMLGLLSDLGITCSDLGTGTFWQVPGDAHFLGRPDPEEHDFHSWHVETSYQRYIGTAFPVELQLGDVVEAAISPWAGDLGKGALSSDQRAFPFQGSQDDRAQDFMRTFQYQIEWELFSTWTSLLGLNMDGVKRHIEAETDNIAANDRNWLSIISCGHRF